ncbi:uncharacterized protein L3040_008964 [Drepanopeziza brunnea f. sp. 'multigermtubi']|uniref:uncharacterized protein n=1 Tax=Drepanopeziza brunnea f. sp. 'multigermtubi' TaxID=698441 RepID=UPI002398D618|nr:hypothetical protein L3040_008964 [Drepanopeziza brunnea f. sp. 'multigermtubi']
MATKQPFTAYCGQQAFTSLQNLWGSRNPSVELAPLPATSAERLNSTNAEKTILYLAYGSNLSAETFSGNRGVKPISACNVHVPSLTLTFDLPGIPYTEPCFANTRYASPPPISTSDYHKDRWHKGLIGVVYEVTPEDYRTIVATEGGGATYQDVIVPCYAIPPGSKSVHHVPAGAPFSAHTLMRPVPSDEEKGDIRTNDGVVRPDPSYAQASARYLRLITSGAEEHELPEEYMAYLYSLRPYTITSARQRAGHALIAAVWMPILLFLLRLGKVFANDQGEIPSWLAIILGLVMTGMWQSYDRVLKKNFGDGERTTGEEKREEGESEWCEKSVRLA